MRRPEFRAGPSPGVRELRERAGRIIHQVDHLHSDLTPSDSERIKEVDQVLLIVCAQRREGGSGRLALTIMQFNGGRQVGCAAIVQEDLACPDTPKRHCAHQPLVMRKVRVVIDAVAQGTHVVQKEIAKRMIGDVG